MPNDPAKDDKQELLDKSAEFYSSAAVHDAAREILSAPWRGIAFPYMAEHGGADVARHELEGGDPQTVANRLDALTQALDGLPEHERQLLEDIRELSGTVQLSDDERNDLALSNRFRLQSGFDALTRR